MKSSVTKNDSALDIFFQKFALSHFGNKLETFMILLYFEIKKESRDKTYKFHQLIYDVEFSINYLNQIYF